MFIKSDRYRVVFTALPKCGSTTMYRFMLNWHGFDDEGNPRDFFAKHRDTLNREGVFLFALSDEAIEPFYEKHRDYFWFSVVRDPFWRIASNYRNKLNRYAKLFDHRAYLKGKLRQLLSGPKAWGDANAASTCIGRYLPFPDFIDGLCVHGVDFDPHYRPLTKLLHLDVIDYKILMRLEHLPTDRQVFLDCLEACGIEVSAVPDFATLNASDARYVFGASYDSSFRARVSALYPTDFEKLGYRGANSPSRSSHS